MSRTPSEKVAKNRDSDDDYRQETSTSENSHSRSSSRMEDQGDNHESIDRLTEQVQLMGVTHSENRTDASNPFLSYGNWVDDLQTYKIMENEYFEEFSVVDPSRKYREGTQKYSFNYLFIDPRKTKDLPSRVKNLKKSTVWSTFWPSIFYVGKGSRYRPYDHLKEALDVRKSSGKSKDKKMQRIWDIWNAEYGVICLYIYHSIIPEEGYTREAAMIDAIELKNLTNDKPGTYYGILATREVTEKRNFGRYLLYKAMEIYLQDEERPIFPNNV